MIHADWRQADEENLLSHRHHLVVQALWEDVEQGLPDSAELPAFLSILEVLVESISKVCRLKEHPALFPALCIGYVLIFSRCVRAGSMGQGHIASKHPSHHRAKIWGHKPIWIGSSAI